MSIKIDVEELTKINAEIQRTLESLKKLRAAKKAIEERVKTYLKERELPGVKHQGTVIQIDTKNKPIRRCKQDRESAIFDLLVSAGIQNPTTLIEKIKEAEKYTKTKETLKIGKL
jgi:hypothetical protein